MHTVTEEQRKKLLEAIKLAKGPGRCAYVIDDQPACVIGQLAYLEGVTVEELVGWDRSPATNEIDKVVENELPGHEKLLWYDLDLLVVLQKAWDLPWHEDEDQTREYLREKVEIARIIHD